MSEAVQRAKAFLVMAGVGLVLVVGVTLLFHLPKDGGLAEKTPEKTKNKTGSEQVSEEPTGPVDLDATVLAMAGLGLHIGRKVLIGLSLVAIRDTDLYLLQLVSWKHIRW